MPKALKAFVEDQHAITKDLEARAQAIEGHHQKHQIDAGKHNLRHRGKAKIEDVIALGSLRALLLYLKSHQSYLHSKLSVAFLYR